MLWNAAKHGWVKEAVGDLVALILILTKGSCLSDLALPVLLISAMCQEKSGAQGGPNFCDVPGEILERHSSLFLTPSLCPSVFQPWHELFALLIPWPLTGI